MLARQRPISMVLILVFLNPGYAQEPVPVVDGVPLVHWRDAGHYYHREAVVYGRIVLTRNIGRYAFLNFHRDYRKHFTAVVRAESFPAFPQAPEIMYRDKLVAVRGTVVEYRDKPEIFVAGPGQIVILPNETNDIVAALRQQLPQRPPGAPRAAAAARSGRVTIAARVLRSAASGASGLCAAPPDQLPAADPPWREAVAGLSEVDADVVALQWGGEASCLQRFNQTLLSGSGYGHLAAPPDERGRVAGAVLSRHPLAAAQRLTDFATRDGARGEYSRPPLQAVLQLPTGETLTIVVVHLSLIHI